MATNPMSPVRWMVVVAMAGLVTGPAISQDQSAPEIQEEPPPRKSVAFRDSGQRLGGDIPTSSVALGDLNGDGYVDAWILNWNWRHASTVWMNNGEGRFTDSGQKLGGGSRKTVVLGDLDRDGDLDAFVTSYDWRRDGDQSNIIWINDGSGVFTKSPQALGNSYSLGVALGDLDGDGDLDAWIANGGTPQPNRVWINDGTGTFSDSGQLLGEENSRTVALGDLDGDGDLDAWVANAGANRVWINDGTGRFEDSSQRLGDSNSRSIALGDLDGDGDLDAWVANRPFESGNPANHVWMNDGLGVFSRTDQSLGASESSSVALGDFDRDGDLDAWVAERSGPNRVWINSGRGIFSETPLTPEGGTNTSVQVADLDGDGDLDAMVGNYLGPNWVWIND